MRRYRPLGPLLLVLAAAILPPRPQVSRADCNATIRGRGGEELVWEGTDERGTAVKPGVYLYRFIAGLHRQSGRWVVLR